MSFQVTKVFRQIWETNPARVILLRGGARSSKSFSLAQIAYLWLMSGMFGPKCISEGPFSIVRATFPALRATVLKDFEHILLSSNRYHLVEHKKTTYTFKYKKREVVFFSADDSHKLRGRKHAIIWFNEGDSCTFDHFTQALLRTEHHAIIDCNPSNSDSWVKTEIEDKRMEERGDVQLHISTFRMNPFLPQGIIDEIKSLEHTDEELYKVYNQGEWAKISGKVFPNYNIVDELPISDKVYFGLDFGWNDPTALIEVRQIENELFIKEHLYKSEMPNSELIAYIREYIGSGKIVADSASPRNIDELRKAGIRVKPAKKGPDSVLQGIQLVRQHVLNIHSESVNVLRELKTYKFLKDSDGEVTNKPVDYNNHLLDALRYAVSTYSKRGLFKILGNY